MIKTQNFVGIPNLTYELERTTKKLSISLGRFCKCGQPLVAVMDSDPPAKLYNVITCDDCGKIQAIIKEKF